jgi:AraC-like DNA-binding protein
MGASGEDAAMPRAASPAISWCRFASWGLGSYPPGHLQPEVVVPDYDVVWVHAGSPIYRLDGQDVVAAAPCVLLLRPGMRMSIRWDERLESRNAYIHFTPRAWPAEVPAPASWPLLTRLPSGEALSPALRHLLFLLSTRPAGWEVLAASALGHVLGMLGHGVLQTLAVTDSEPGPLTQQVANLLVPLWQPGVPLRAPSLAGLARAAGMSREGFCRAFHVEVGCAPLQALRLVRLERAARLLLNEGTAVGVVAARCGFADPFVFSRAFRAAFDCAPRDFRTAFRAGRAELHLAGSPQFVAFRCCLASALQWHE